MKRLAFTAATAAFMLSAAPSAMGDSSNATHAAAGSQLVSYTAIANAPGLSIHGIYMGISLDVPEVNSSLTTGGVGAGLASIAWPGDIGGNGGTAFLVLFPSAPSWVKIFNDPIKAETHSTGTHHVVNKTVPGTVMTSSASHTLVTASSTTQLGIPTLGTLGGFSGSSSAKLIGPHSIRAVSQSAVTNLSLAGGQIDIGSLVSSAVAVSDGKVAHGHANTTVSGVTIAGIPVTIDREGIHLAKSVVPTAAATKVLSTALAALHLKTTFTNSIVSRQGGTASYDAGALVLTYSPNGSTYSITLGRSAAQVNATPSFVSSTFTPPPTSTGKPSTSSGGAGSTSEVGGLPSTSSSVPDTGQPPSVATQIVNAAADIALAGGPTGLMIFGVIAATLLCAFALPRVAARFLDVPAEAGCEEDT